MTVIFEDLPCLVRGDTWLETVTGLGDLTGATDIWLAFKEDPEDADSGAELLISMTVGLEEIAGAAATVPANGSITVVGAAANGVIQWYLHEDESAKIEPNKLFYDIQKRIPSGLIFLVVTPKAGRVPVVADITRATT